MNPLLIARNLRDEYLRLLKTHFNPRQQELKAAFRAYKSNVLPKFYDVPVTWTYHQHDRPM